MAKLISKLKQRKIKWNPSFNWYNHTWFRYHRKFYGALIKKGKKISAFKVFSRIKSKLKIKEFFDPYYLFLVAMLQITPSLILIPRRVGAMKKSVAFPLNEHKKITFAVKWILKLIKDSNKGRLTIDSIVDLLYNSLYYKGLAIEKKNYNHRLGLVNRYLLRRFFR